MPANICVSGAVESYLLVNPCVFFLINIINSYIVNSYYKNPYKKGEWKVEEVIRKAKKRQISKEILKLFKKKGGVYQIARRSNLEGTNLYQRIYRCDKAMDRIEKVLSLVNHGLDYRIIPFGKQTEENQTKEKKKQKIKK